MNRREFLKDGRTVYRGGLREAPELKRDDVVYFVDEKDKNNCGKFMRVIGLTPRAKRPIFPFRGFVKNLRRNHIVLVRRDVPSYPLGKDTLWNVAIKTQERR